MAARVRVVVNEAGFDALRRDPRLRDDMLSRAQDVIVEPARRDAPQRTGAGAASIHAEPVFVGEGWVVRAAWDQTRYYMGFHDLGTRHLPPRHFLTRPELREGRR